MSDDPSKRQDSTDSKPDVTDRRSYLRGVAAAGVLGAGLVGATSSAAAGEDENDDGTHEKGRDGHAASVFLEAVCYDDEEEKSKFRIYNDTKKTVKVLWKTVDDTDLQSDKRKLHGQEIAEFWVSGAPTVALFDKKTKSKLDIADADTDTDCDDVDDTIELRGVCCESSEKHKKGERHSDRALFYVRNYTDEDKKVYWKVKGGDRSGKLYLYAMRTRKLWVPLQGKKPTTVNLYRGEGKIATAQANTDVQCGNGGNDHGGKDHDGTDDGGKGHDGKKNGK